MYYNIVVYFIVCYCCIRKIFSFFHQPICCCTVALYGSRVSSIVVYIIVLYSMLWFTLIPYTKKQSSFSYELLLRTHLALRFVFYFDLKSFVFFHLYTAKEEYCYRLCFVVEVVKETILRWSSEFC